MLKRWGDRKDGTYLKKIDSMHTIMPLMYPNRCDNEAFLTERIDLTNINAYLERKNAGNTEYAYNLFQIMVTALLKVITLRPKMNRFIANKTIYQRNEVSAAFTVKKEFSDDGGEALAFIHAKDGDNINTIHDEIFRQVGSFHSGNGRDPEDAPYADSTGGWICPIPGPARLDAAVCHCNGSLLCFCRADKPRLDPAAHRISSSHKLGHHFCFLRDRRKKEASVL